MKQTLNELTMEIFYDVEMLKFNENERLAYYQCKQMFDKITEEDLIDLGQLLASYLFHSGMAKQIIDGTIYYDENDNGIKTDDIVEYESKACEIIQEIEKIVDKYRSQLK